MTAEKLYPEMKQFEAGSPPQILVFEVPTPGSTLAPDLALPERSLQRGPMWEAYLARGQGFTSGPWWFSPAVSLNLERNQASTTGKRVRFKGRTF